MEYISGAQVRFDDSAAFDTVGIDGLRIQFTFSEPDQESRWIDVGESLWPLQSQKGSNFVSYRHGKEAEAEEKEQAALDKFLGKADA